MSDPRPLPDDFMDRFLELVAALQTTEGREFGTSVLLVKENGSARDDLVHVTVVGCSSQKCLKEISERFNKSLVAISQGNRSKQTLH